MSPVNSMFVCIKKKYIYIIISKSVLKMADIDNLKMLNIGADNRSTPRLKLKCSNDVTSWMFPLKRKCFKRK